MVVSVIWSVTTRGDIHLVCLAVIQIGPTRASASRAHYSSPLPMIQSIGICGAPRRECGAAGRISTAVTNGKPVSRWEPVRRTCWRPAQTIASVLMVSTATTLVTAPPNPMWPARTILGAIRCADALITDAMTRPGLHARPLLSARPSSAPPPKGAGSSTSRPASRKLTVQRWLRASGTSVK